MGISPFNLGDNPLQHNWFIGIKLGHKRVVSKQIAGK
jgi:hypothetical protein